MNIGLLLHDDSKTDLFGKVQKAVDYYIAKYDRMPNRCFVHPSELPEGKTCQVGPVELVGNKSVRPNHYWVGCEERA